MKEKIKEEIEKKYPCDEVDKNDIRIISIDIYQSNTIYTINYKGTQHEVKFYN